MRCGNGGMRAQRDALPLLYPRETVKHGAHRLPDSEGRSLPCTSTSLVLSRSPVRLAGQELLFPAYRGATEADRRPLTGEYWSQQHPDWPGLPSPRCTSLHWWISCCLRG